GMCKGERVNTVDPHPAPTRATVAKPSLDRPGQLSGRLRTVLGGVGSWLRRCHPGLTVPRSARESRTTEWDATEKVVSQCGWPAAEIAGSEGQHRADGQRVASLDLDIRRGCIHPRYSVLRCPAGTTEAIDEEIDANQPCSPGRAVLWRLPHAGCKLRKSQACGGNTERICCNLQEVRLSG